MIVALAALFVALGGTSYAVSQIDGKSIRDRSVPGSKLKKSTVTAKELDLKHIVVPRARIADQAAHLFVSHGRRAGTKAHKAGTVSSAATAAQGSLAKLSVGETQTLIDAPPFTFRARCSDLGNDDYKITIEVMSSEANWSGGTAPGQWEYWDSAEAAGPQLGADFGKQFVAAPSGAALDLGAPTLGVHVLGADCVASFYAIG
jgi:hypothetical protein